MAGRAYEGDRRTPDPRLASIVQGFDKNFIYRHTRVLNPVCLSIYEERKGSPWLVDTDVIEVFKTLVATMKTLSSGIYYETLPEGAVRVSLFRRLKELFDAFMQPQPQIPSASTGPMGPSGLDQPLKVSDAIDVLNFLMFAATVNSNSRPRSRQYLDLINTMAEQTAPASQTGSLIVP